MSTPQPFASLLTHFRDNAKLSKVDLAQAIEKTDGYIRKLEMGYTPPTFPICQKLVPILKLTTDETIQFYTAAVLGRIGDDRMFFEEIEKLKTKTPTKAQPRATPTKITTTHPIQYCIDLAYKSDLITAPIETPFIISITRFITETGSSLLQHTFHKQGLRIFVTTPATIAIGTWINDLKSTVSRQLKNQFPKLIGEGIVIWQPTHAIFSVGEIPPSHEDASWSKTQTSQLQTSH